MNGRNFVQNNRAPNQGFKILESLNTNYPHNDSVTTQLIRNYISHGYHQKAVTTLQPIKNIHHNKHHKFWLANQESNNTQIHHYFKENHPNIYTQDIIHELSFEYILQFPAILATAYHSLPYGLASKLGNKIKALLNQHTQAKIPHQPQTNQQPMNETFTHCPTCQSIHFVKAGFNAGKQRYKCKDCNYYFTVQKPSRHKDEATKEIAIKMYLEGLGFRAIGRLLGISYGTVYQWVKQLGQKHQIKPDDKEQIDIVELDEIHSYTKHKKTTAGLGLPLTDTQSKS